MKLVFIGLVMIASINTFVMTNDTDSDWIPLNSDYESEVTEASFRSIARMAEISSDSESTNVPVSLNRKYTPKASHYNVANLQNNNSAERVKIFVGCDNSKQYKTNLFVCGGCDHPKGHFDTIASHMHNVDGCLPKEGITCKNCSPQDAPRFIKVIDLLNHNQQLHHKMTAWNCGWCGTQTPPEKFMEHVAFYVNGKSAETIFKDYPESIVINKRRWIYNNGKITQNSKRKIESSAKVMKPLHKKVKRDPVINLVDHQNITWLWYKPAIGSNGTTELIKFGEFTVDEMEAMIALKKMPSKVN